MRIKRAVQFHFIQNEWTYRSLSGFAICFQLLTKQLEVLRTVNESRMRIYEEVDKTQQEVDRTNERLKQEAKDDKLTIKK